MSQYLGIGVDIEDIDRFRNLKLDEDKIFLNRIFTKNELDYCFSKMIVFQHLAARFAGKEAIIKALGSLKNIKNMNYNEIEILNNEIGVPRAKLTNSIFKGLKIDISLSHSKGKAMAFAIINEEN